MFPTHHWLITERQALIDFLSRAQIPEGFGWLNSDGSLLPQEPCLWLVARFTHVMACEHLAGNPSAWEMLDHGVHSLLDYFKDPEHPGFFSSPAGREGDTKEAFPHGYVALAAAGACMAGHPRGPELAQAAQALYLFTDPRTGLLIPEYNRDFTQPGSYYGTGPSLHLVESSLALYDYTKDPEHLERSLRVCRFMVDKARELNYHIPEHMSSTWDYDPHFHENCKDDPAQPWGPQIGHAVEWARLIIQIAVRSRRLGIITPEQAYELIDPSIRIFRTAVNEGWHNGFVFSTDYEGHAIIADRHWWVTCEVLCTAHTLAGLAAEYPEYSAAVEHYGPIPDSNSSDNIMGLSWSTAYWWKWVADHFIASPGHWWPELDAQNQPISRAWKGMPEPYHTYQALLYPLLPDYAASFAGGVAK